MDVIYFILVLIAGLSSIPAYILFCEIIAGLATIQDPQEEGLNAHVKASAAVIVPAHNEGGGILPTLADIKSQLA